MPKTLIFTRGKPYIENIRYISICLRLRQGIYAPIKRILGLLLTFSVLISNYPFFWNFFVTVGYQTFCTEMLISRNEYASLC